MGGLAEFFYNIVPGTFILLSLNILFKDMLIRVLKYIPEGEGFRLAIFAIISLFIGFFLQLLTKKLKEPILYNKIWKDVANEDKMLYRNVQNYLVKKQLINKVIGDDEYQRKQVFFTIDNYLSNSGGGRLLPHFASRSAYWSNFGWTFGLITLLILIAIFSKMTNIPVEFLLLGLVGSVFLSLVSFETFFVHQKQHYEITLRTFWSILVIEYKVNFSDSNGPKEKNKSVKT